MAAKDRPTIHTSVFTRDVTALVIRCLRQLEYQAEDLAAGELPLDPGLVNAIVAEIAPRIDWIEVRRHFSRVASPLIENIGLKSTRSRRE